jgi:hypothetical protein
MQELTVKIPEHKLSFFLDLAHHLGIEVVGLDSIAAAHQSIVRNRIQTANESDLTTWQEAKQKFNSSK